ncbi:hypothetical protein [Acaryochloris marina]|uniref:hypothetical protein n=1 Tax=Acaryochloris marina TaxID=155978 RepID=UPI0006746B5E|nr:hypothetical protein [Acaryochloris marina]
MIDLKQSKTDRYRLVTLNSKAVSVIQSLLRSRVFEDEDYLFWCLHGPVADGDEYGEALVSIGGAKGSLWKPYAAEDVGVLAV